MEKIQIWKKLKSHKLLGPQSFPQYSTNHHSNYIGFPQTVTIFIKKINNFIFVLPTS